jgi:hypothetical protein
MDERGTGPWVCMTEYSGFDELGMLPSKRATPITVTKPGNPKGVQKTIALEFTPCMSV